MSSHAQHIQFKELLRERGYKATPARLELLSVLAQAKKPMSVDALRGRLRASAPDTATVYRALKELKNSRLVRQIDLQHGHAHYELTDTRTDHHHMVCTECGTIEDFEGCDIDSVMKRALRQTKLFSTLSDHALELFGICNTCQKNAA